METSHSPSYKWSILLVVTLVSFISNLDATIVVIGLPKIMQGLNITLVTGLLIITSYIIVSTVFILPAGKWADIVGTKRIFILGLIIFTISTVLCGTANSGTTLIIYRLIQGGGAALAAATSTPTIMKSFPDNELGLALGIASTSWVIGAIAGPVAGGILISQFGWRSIFFATVPFLIICIIGAFCVMKDTTVKKIKSKTDWIGILAFGAGLSDMMILLSEGHSWGWLSATSIGFFIACIVLSIVFVFNELRAENPLFNFRLLLNKNYTIGLGITLSYCSAYFSLPLLLSIYLQSALHLSTMNAGLIMIALSAPQLIASPLGGKLADSFGAAKTLVISLGFLTVGLFLLGNLGAELSIPAVIIPLIIVSVANSVSWPSVSKVVLSDVPKTEAGSASGMFYTVLNISKALSQTLVIVILEFSIPPEIISKAIVGMADLNNIHIESNLISSIDINFRIFMIFLVLAFLLGLFILVSKEKKNIDIANVDLD